MNCLVIGDVSVDTIAHLDVPVETQSTHFPKALYTRLGGSAAGKALNLDYFNHSVDLISRIGQDMHGSMIQEHFSKTAVRTHFIETKDASISHFNLLSRNRERISIFTSHPDINPKPDFKTHQTRIDTSDQIFLELSGTFKDWAPLIDHPNVWVDLHDFDGSNPFMDPYIKVASVIMMSDAALSLEASHEIGQSLSKTKRAVLITRGSRGVTLYEKGTLKDFPVQTQLEAVDTDGAGDAFMVALYHYLKEDFKTAIPKAIEHAEKAIMTKALAPQK